MAEFTFEQWIEELIKITAQEINELPTTIKINMEAAREWYNDGFTPYMCFRETFNNEDDCGY